MTITDQPHGRCSSQAIKSLIIRHNEVIGRRSSAYIGLLIMPACEGIQSSPHAEEALPKVTDSRSKGNFSVCKVPLLPEHRELFLQTRICHKPYGDKETSIENSKK